MRGVGKTVLLNRVQEITETKPFKSVLIEAPENKRLAALIVPSLRQILFALDRFESASKQVKRGLRVLKAFVAIVKINLGDIEVG